jgi:hypothetical protein
MQNVHNYKIIKLRNFLKICSENFRAFKIRKKKQKGESPKTNALSLLRPPPLKIRAGLWHESKIHATPPPQDSCRVVVRKLLLVGAKDWISTACHLSTFEEIP